MWYDNSPDTCSCSKQPNTVAGHAHGDEVILGMRWLRELHHIQDVASRLVERLHGGQYIAVGERLGFGQQAFRAL